MGESDPNGVGRTRRWWSAIIDDLDSDTVVLQVESVVTTIKPESRRKLGRTVAEVDVSSGLRSANTHNVEAVKRRYRAKEHRRCNSHLTTHDVDAPVHAIREVDVEMARLAKHHVGAWRGASMGVRSGVVGSHVRLHLDDPASYTRGNEDLVE
jgi:hypothetical protein